MTKRTLTLRDRQLFAKELEGLCQDFAFPAGRSAHRRSEFVSISIDHFPPEDGEPRQHLLTVHTTAGLQELLVGLLWTLRGEPGLGFLKRGRTERRGQSWLPELPDGGYRLRVECLTVAPARAPLSPRLCVSTFASAVPRQEIASTDGQTTAVIREAKDGKLTLEVKANLQGWGEARLARFEVAKADGTTLCRGFVGLYSVDGGSLFGNLDLDYLASETRKQWTPSCTVSIECADLASLVPEDRETLERSLEATDHALSQKVIREALAFLAGQQ